MTLNLDGVLSVLLLFLFSFNFNHQTGKLCFFFLSVYLLLHPPLNCAMPASKATSPKSDCSYAEHHHRCDALIGTRLQTRLNIALLEKWGLNLGLWWNSIGHRLLLFVVSFWTPAHNLYSKPETGSTSRPPMCSSLQLPITSPYDGTPVWTQWTA